MDVSVTRVGLVLTAVSPVSGKKLVAVRCMDVMVLTIDLGHAQYFLLDIKKGVLEK